MISFRACLVGRGTSGRAFILIAVAWLVLILGLFVVYHLRAAQIGLALIRSEEESSESRWAAFSLWEILKAEYSTGKAKADEISRIWSLSAILEKYGEELEESFPEMRYDIIIEDEGGKVRIAQDQYDRVVSALFAFGIQKLRAEVMAEQMIAQVEGYQTNPTGYDLRIFQNILQPNADWDTVSGSEWFELSKVFSSVPSLGDGKPDINLASKEILLTVEGVSDRIADDIVFLRNGADGIRGTSDDFNFQSTDDFKKIRSVSQFSEFEVSRLTSGLVFSSSQIRVQLSASNKGTGSWCKIDAVLQTQDESLAVVSYTERMGVAAATAEGQ